MPVTVQKKRSKTIASGTIPFTLNMEFVWYGVEPYYELRIDLRVIGLGHDTDFGNKECLTIVYDDKNKQWAAGDKNEYKGAGPPPLEIIVKLHKRTQQGYQWSCIEAALPDMNDKYQEFLISIGFGPPEREDMVSGGDSTYEESFIVKLNTRLQGSN